MRWKYIFFASLNILQLLNYSKLQIFAIQFLKQLIVPKLFLLLNVIFHFIFILSFFLHIQVTILVLILSQQRLNIVLNSHFLSWLYQISPYFALLIASIIDPVQYRVDYTLVRILHLFLQLLHLVDFCKLVDNIDILIIIIIRLYFTLILTHIIFILNTITRRL